ncbi:MAG: bifunctional pyr operon transcriptional regulator/uracil phosphoribosyltransferase [Bacteroidetes bacterium]|nr:MAG: bifunctional pyr operon transcriptional regulator/uracil phosphoribosyltransferase [Bacteroidota bacterium]
MNRRSILNEKSFELTINRLCYELIENHNDFSNTALVGLQPRGANLAERISAKLKEILGTKDILCGNIDVTFSRDDFRRRDNPIVPQSTNMNFIIEDKTVVLIDDVLFSGRTVRAGLDEILSYGRPRSVELLVLIDRRFSRQIPIEPNYVGKAVDTVQTQKVRVEWSEIDGKDQVYLETE